MKYPACYRNIVLNTNGYVKAQAMKTQAMKALYVNK